MPLSQKAENKSEDLPNDQAQPYFAVQNSQAYEILPFSDEYYPEIVKLWNSAFPTQIRTEEEWRYKDAQLAERLNKRRYVAKIDGRVIGYANLQNDELMTDPEVYVTRVAVDSKYHRQGVGMTLYKRLENELRLSIKARAVRGWVQEDNQQGISFAQKLGFLEFHRVWSSELEIKTFDELLLVPSKPPSSKIEFKTLEDLKTDVHRNSKLYELECELLLDMDAPDQVKPPPFELFVHSLQNDPQVLQDGYFVAVDNDKYVGLSVFLFNRANNELTTRLTGVRASYRRQGIALKLKLLGIEYARRKGYTKIRTANDSANAPMLAINNQLGFKREPAWILYSKNL